MNGIIAETALEKNDIGFFRVDFQEGTIDYSQVFSKLLTGDENVQFSHSDFTRHISSRDKFLRQAAYSQMLRTGKIQYEPTVDWKDGTQHKIRITGNCEFDESGKPRIVTGIVQAVADKKSTEQTHRETEAHFQNIIQQAPVAMCLLRGPALVMEIANDSFLHLAGKDYSILGKSIRSTMPELEGQGYFEMLEEVYKTGKQVHGNESLTQLVRNGNKVNVYFNFVYSPLKHADNSVSGVIIAANEVTDQVQTKRILEHSEMRFRSLIEQAPVATCLFVGKEMRIEMANDIMINYWGKNKSVIGKPLAEAVPELVGQPFLDILDNVYTTGIAYEAREAPAQLNVGGVMGTYYFDFTYKPITNESGEVYGIMDMAVNVTDRVMASRKLKESELFARSIIYNSPVAKAVFTGENMVIETVNENMLLMMGRDPSIIGKPIGDAMPELSSTPIPERLLHVYRTGETFYQPEEKLELIRFGVSYTGYYNYIYKPLRDTSGNIYGVIVTATEVTDQVLARRKVEELTASLEQLVQERTEQLQAVNEELRATNEELAKLNETLIFSNEELQQFAHVASHDLKEPIRKIKIFLNRIESDKENILSGKSRAFMEKVHVATDRMFSMIEGVLTYSTVNASQQRIQEIDLNRIIDEIFIDLEVLIAQKNAKINYRNLPTIQGAYILIYQLFYNLITNALKFSRQGIQPVIDINSSAEIINSHQFVRVDIKDNGIGFNQQEAEKIFNTFTRLNSKDLYEGTGLGLSLCKKIVQRHGGIIEARGSKGEGATFIIHLPVKQTEINV